MTPEVRQLVCDVLSSVAYGVETTARTRNDVQISLHAASEIEFRNQSLEVARELRKLLEQVRSGE